MLTDDEKQELRDLIASVLEDHGFERLPTAAALRMRRMREQKRNNEKNKSVTLKGQRRNKSVTGPRTESPTNATWAAYADAYKRRYSVEPVRNAAVNGQLAGFVGRLGGEEAPQVAAYYVSLNRGLYLSARHAVPLMVKHAEALRMEWVTGQGMTDTQARMADRTQTNANVWGKLIAEAEDETKQNPH